MVGHPHIFGASPPVKLREHSQMSSQETMEPLEIADLEQDIGGVYAVEAGESHISGESIIVTMFIPPK